MTKPDSVTYTIDDEETITEAIVTAVATLKNKDARGLPSLYHEGLHPEGLNMLFSTSGRGRVEFYYYGTKVVVKNGERVIIMSVEELTA